MQMAPTPSATKATDPPTRRETRHAHFAQKAKDLGRLLVPELHQFSLGSAISDLVVAAIKGTR